jgi:hypothetical protein
MYSDYVVSRKVFFLKNWMTLIISKTSQEITKPLFYYELTIPSKNGILRHVWDKFFNKK